MIPKAETSGLQRTGSKNMDVEGGKAEAVTNFRTARHEQTDGSSTQPRLSQTPSELEGSIPEQYPNSSHDTETSALQQRPRAVGSAPIKQFDPGQKKVDPSSLAGMSAMEHTDETGGRSVAEGPVPEDLVALSHAGFLASHETANRMKDMIHQRHHDDKKISEDEDWCRVREVTKNQD